jgi:hypothetical protein
VLLLLQLKLLLLLRHLVLLMLRLVLLLQLLLSWLLLLLLLPHWIPASRWCTAGSNWLCNCECKFSKLDVQTRALYCSTHIANV